MILAYYADMNFDVEVAVAAIVGAGVLRLPMDPVALTAAARGRARAALLLLLVERGVEHRARHHDPAEEVGPQQDREGGADGAVGLRLALDVAR